MCSCKNFALDHVLTCKKHTGATGGYNHVMDVLAQRSRDVKYGNSGKSHTVINRPVWSSDSVLEGCLPTNKEQNSGKGVGGFNENLATFRESKLPDF